MRTYLTICLILLGFSPTHGSETEKSPPVEITLVSEATTIAAGETFSVGILQKIQPTYHTYWRNPGTVGLPFSIEWKLPPGFKTNAIQWPTPEISKMSVYDVWGYHNEALLVVDLVAPKSLVPGSKVKLAGKGIWMCCAASCHPGSKDFELEMSVSEKLKLDPEWNRRFAATRRDQPRSSSKWTLACSVSGKKYRLTVSSKAKTAGPPKNIRFFDYDRQVSSEKGQRVNSKSNAAVIRMQQEVHTGEKLSRLRGILVADTEWEPGVKVLAVDIPIEGRN